MKFMTFAVLLAALSPAVAVAAETDYPLTGLGKGADVDSCVEAANADLQAQANNDAATHGCTSTNLSLSGNTPVQNSDGSWSCTETGSLSCITADGQ